MDAFSGLRLRLSGYWNCLTRMGVSHSLRFFHAVGIVATTCGGDKLWRGRHKGGSKAATDAVTTVDCQKIIFIFSEFKHHFVFFARQHTSSLQTPLFIRPSWWYRAVMPCSFSTHCIHDTPCLNAASFNIFAHQWFGQKP